MRFALLFVMLVACGGGRSSKTPGAAPSASGERTCKTEADCAADEVCRGPDGCEQAATCQKRASLNCTMGKQATMCGCDGVTFEANNHCPGRPVFRHAACDAPARCVRGGGADCDEPARPCPAGSTREYVDGCWEACVPVASCACASDADCPTAAPRCDTTNGRCAA